MVPLRRGGGSMGDQGWIWRRRLYSDRKGGDMAEASGETIFFDGFECGLLDRDGGQVKGRGLAAPMALPEDLLAGQARAAAFSESGVRSAVAYDNPPGEDGSTLAYFGRFGAFAGSRRSAAAIESMAFESDSVLNVCESDGLRRRLQLRDGGQAEEVPVRTSAAGGVVAVAGRVEVVRDGAGRFSLRRGSRQLGAVDFGGAAADPVVSPSGNTLATLVDGSRLEIFTTDGAVVQSVSPPGGVRCFAFAPDGSVLYRIADALVHADLLGRTQWTREHAASDGSRAADMEVRSNVVRIAFADGAKHVSAVYDLYGELLLSYETDGPHRARLFLRGKRFWALDETGVGMQPLF